jgi:excisionase family DNA binding protein
MPVQWTAVEVPEPHESEPWASVDGVARHLGVRKETVYRWIERRGLPAHKIGRLWKCKLSDVDAWVRSGGAADEGDSNGNREDASGGSDTP